MRRGSDAQRVSRHLSKYGIEVGGNEEWLDLEISTLRFFPNHIEGVIDQVLRGGDVPKKMAKAQDQGFAYFNKPVSSLLSKRSGAVRPDAVEVAKTDDIQSLYNLVVSTLLDADMTRHDTLLLFTKVPALVKEKQDLRDAIRICRERNARSISYLAGILRRGEQRRETKKQEILVARSEHEPWSPPEDYRGLAPSTIDSLQQRWLSLFEINPDPQGI